MTEAQSRTATTREVPRQRKALSRRWRTALPSGLIGALGTLALAWPALAFPPLRSAEIYTDATLTTPGLVGSYVDANLRNEALPADWRLTQTIAGTRVDAAIDFAANEDWGERSEVGLTSGSDSNWELFSVQWDGVLEVLHDGTQIATWSDDSSRLWIDLDGDGHFDHAPPELVDNHWGTPQGATRGELSVPLAKGVYAIRIQYEEEFFGNLMRLEVRTPPTVRVGYVVPSNRSARPGLEANLEQFVIPTIRDWYCDQMERHGFGRRTPRFETQADGVTPEVHVVDVPRSDAEMQSDPWGSSINAVQEAGFPVGQSGVVYLFIPEVHEQQPDGRLIGSVALGGGGGSGDDGGVAVIGSALASLVDRDMLQDEQPYAGAVLEPVGPLPLVQGTTFPWFEGGTFGSIASSWLGALTHELTHGFGIPHDFRSDANFLGNLMGNGLRGMRGALYPELSADHARLSRANAAALSLSQYFTPCEPGGPLPRYKSGEFVAGNDRPDVSILTSGTQTPVEGRLRIAFSAADPDGLALAILRRQGGDVIDEKTLSGTEATLAFETPYFEPGQAETFQVGVYDVYGYRREVSQTLTPRAGENRAPWPSIVVDPPQQGPNAPIQLDAGWTRDAESPTSELAFEWSFHAGGPFVSGGAVESVSYPAPGIYEVRVRVTDPDGGRATSLPIPVRVAPACDDFLDNDGDGAIDYPADLSCLTDDHPTELPEPGQAIGLLSGAMALALSKRARRGPRRTRN